MLTSLPNLLTIARVAIIPVILACFYVDTGWARWTATALFVIAAISDYLDGYLARAMNAQSPFGRWLDPVADKLLVGAVVVMLVAWDNCPVIPAVIIILRELLISGLREYMAEAKVGLPVSKLAKWKTMSQMLAVGFLLLGEAGPVWLAAPMIGELLVWAAAVLTVITGYDYVQIGLRQMHAEHNEKTGASTVKPNHR